MPEEKKALPDLSSYYFKTSFISLDQPLPLMSPVRKRLSTAGTSEVPSLRELGTTLGMDLEADLTVQLFEQHEKRFRTYRLLHTLFSWLGYFLFAGIAFGSMAYVAFILLDFGDSQPGFLLYLLVFLLAYISFRSASRVVSVLFDRYYADTLAFVSCLYLLGNLARKNSLLGTGDRRRLLSRIRGLRKYLSLLPYQFGVSESASHPRAGGQFKHMHEFVEEKENQIIAPSSGSQVEMFGELLSFLDILLTGQYGEFTIQVPAGVESAPAPEQPTTVPGRLLRFLGFITPIFLVLAVFFFPEQLSFLGIERNVVSYISLAWLLLAIDANLKLGIVQGLSNLAKTIKDLS